MGLNISKGKTKQIVSDMMINLLGTGFPLAMLQLVILPIVAQIISAEAYGQMQSTMSVVYLIGGTLGGSLSTVRLVRDYKYKEEQLSGDYKILYWANSAAVIVFTAVMMPIYMHGISFINVALVVMVALLNFVMNYVEVGFRLNLDYRRIFIDKVLCCVGYAVGFGLFWLTKQWEWIFIMANGVPIVYCAQKSGILKEPRKITGLFRGTLKAFGNLGIANLLSKALVYFDKFMLYPLLGGEAVSVYFAANIFGKLILRILEPINNVVLSYLSKRSRVGREIWQITMILGGIFCVIMYFICLFISEPVLHIFYPQWADEAVALIPVATASLCISSFISIIRPLTYKDLPMYQQIIINGVSLLAYIAVVLALYRTNGLMGCCVALLICYIVRLLITMIFCFGGKITGKLRKSDGKSDK